MCLFSFPSTKGPKTQSFRLWDSSKGLTSCFSRILKRVIPILDLFVVVTQAFLLRHTRDERPGDLLSLPEQLRLLSPRDSGEDRSREQFTICDLLLTDTLRIRLTWSLYVLRGVKITPYPQRVTKDPQVLTGSLSSFSLDEFQTTLSSFLYRRWSYLYRHPLSYLFTVTHSRTISLSNETPEPRWDAEIWHISGLEYILSGWNLFPDLGCDG